MNRSALFKRGLRQGLPIVLGYLPVSITFGMVCTSGGLPPLLSVLMSLTNVTSAGQFAGLQLIREGAGLIELITTMVIINFRYAFMSLSLSQKLAPGFSTWQRMIFSFGVTDEVFGVASAEEGELRFPFTLGLMVGPILSWTAGTAIGACCAGILPATLRQALGITLYAMFIAIIMPALKKSRGVLAVVLCSAGLAALFYYLPALKGISSGWVIILVSVSVCAVAALLDGRRQDSHA